jgi:ubiquinone/menaquinone biosynthesis C-methylase UbiE
MESLLDKFIRWWRFKKIITHIPQNSIVCDIGCGKNPYLLKKISNLIKYGIGFDKGLENYKDSKLELKNLEISKNIPLGNESCDVVTMMAVLEHLFYPQEILNESFRILKNGGKLILTTPTPISKPILEFLAYKISLIDKREISSHKNYFWLSDIKKLLAQAGF